MVDRRDLKSAETTAAAAALQASFRRHHGEPVDAARVDDALLLACEMGHDIFPKTIAHLIQGRAVVDVGCGNTLYGLVMMALGARSYVGFDPRLDLSRRNYRLRRVQKGSIQTDVAVSDLMPLIPGLTYAREQLLPQGRYDIAVMQAVTEHVMDLESLMAAIAGALRPGGLVWFLHDSFQSWGGHHEAPHSPRKFDPADPAHLRFADWAHLTFDPPEDHPFRTNLNRVRLDDLRRIVERHFTLRDWTEVRESRAVLIRITPEIEARVAPVTPRELRVKHVICLAERR